MAAGEQRIDKWLFFARVCKSRSLAQKLTLSGAVRVNREKITHSARLVRPGDVLTISVADRIRVLKVLEAGTRRGPAPEAALLFEDLTPPPEPRAASAPEPQVEPGERPTRREREEARRYKEAWSEEG
ncbi:RNA-binding S4 domain-containing protein [Aureimonas sp. AU4]|uniref:RNA-binding S4 domain-containing protein n=1 Tax=Aureimonas sp. AU4 TaxID=1638163 RepID=UPI0007857B03|nr:RNA-binding S4 domain-containing protein [Aureimonas sp. AU4]